ncbi:MAG: NifU N-terminal domain-containing protein [Chloroflexota bacterium]
MDVVSQQTPNPNALKFILPQKIFEKPLSFPNQEAAQVHPLAVALFQLGSIYNVFMVQDFVTVNKLPDVEWSEIEEHIVEAIRQYLQVDS